MMAITSAMQSATMGMQRGINGLGENAAEIARSSQMDGSAVRDISKPLVEQTQNLQQVEASAKVLKTEDEMIGRLIDRMA
ncbi:hypothetical protein [Thiobaca trueperi]|uniref:Flagellar basal body rod FlgEFG protein n=1 Tax=Thiobaca trueperi TaxID=127458 RepID=A0A4R3N786_9GAMM|nr:hypothetical protein [Thiobaca trueperi]TCT23996.1 hypothetical protein EDC35_101313 [Thiobaca trueperi]